MPIGSRIQERFYKLAADNIIRLLAKVYDSPLSDKRWVWELIQNAKDVPNKFKRVSVEIHLYQDKLVFKHNGDCFSDNDLISLVLQVSSKDSANEGEQNQTGKFGTGFITTHLLSRVIDVKGVVLNPDTKKHQLFNIRLDRSARKSEDMIPSIKKAVEKVDGMDKFPLVEGYENRKEDSFDTSFTYPLETEEAKSSAEVGIKDLVNTLPITMVSLPQIKRVLVENHKTGEKQIYKCDSEKIFVEEEGKIIQSCVNINGKKKYYLSYNTFKDGDPYIGLTIETKITKDGKYELVARDPDQPVLFRDFPLIGSETFYFPYVLNGFTFYPTEPRDGILLNSNEPEPQKNRAIIENAIQAVLSFNEWLISEGARNTFLMASSREPEPKTPWDMTYALPWIKRQMELWHKALLKQRLIETSNPDENIELSKIKIPDYGGGSETNIKFYDFLSDFKILYLPLRKQLVDWANVLSWTKDNRVSKDDFFKQLEAEKNVSKLAKRLDKNEDETCEWLNKLYKFVIEQGDVSLFDRYCIIPNRSGNFCFLRSLKTDSEQRIPEKIRDIVNPIFRENLCDLLLAENIDGSIFTNMRAYTLDNLIDDVNKTIRQTTGRRISVSSEEWKRVSKCVYDIISLNSDNEEEAENRDEMRQFVSHFVDGISKGKHIDNLPSSLWEEADKFVILYIPYLIENKAKTLSELGSNLLCYPKQHNNDECVSWLNDFNDIICSHNMRIPTLMRIYPNQTGKLLPLTKLHYDKGIPSELIDLNVTANGEDWREKLLNRRIRGYETQDPLGAGDIYKGISDKFTSKYTGESKKFEIARKAITLCPNSQADTSDNISVVHGFLKKFYADLPDCHEIENASGFSWEIFVAYILKSICERISTAMNIFGLSDMIGENEEGTINYVDSVLEYAMKCYGKRYQNYVTNDYNLWINQNGDFCKLCDISKDDNIDEEIKDISKSPIVDIDYKGRLLRKNMNCERFVQTTINTENILNEIDKKIIKYDKDENRSLQVEGLFTFFTDLGQIVDKHKKDNYETYLVYFCENRNRLIVGSLNNKDTIAVVSSIVSSQKRMGLFKQLNDKFSDEELQKIIDGEYGHVIMVEDTSGEIPLEKEEVVKELTKLSKEDLEELAEGANPEKVLKKLNDYYDKLPTDTDCDYDAVLSVGEDNSLSVEERRAYSEEAREAVLEKLKEDGFDTSNVYGGYSVVSGVKKDGVEYPLVIKSYRNSGYTFKINPNEWIQLNKSNSMLLIYTGSEIGKVTFSNLFRNQDNMSIQFSLEALGDTRNVWRFAEILKYFKECHFDFSNLAIGRYESMSKYRSGQNNPNAFLDLSPDDKNLID